MSGGLDLSGIGYEFDDLDLPPLSPLPLDRLRNRRDRWWTTSEAEAFHLDLPDFDSGANRARYMVDQMGRAALATIPGSTIDDAIFPHDGVLVSLRELLATMDARELAVLLGPGAEDV